MKLTHEQTVALYHLVNDVTKKGKLEVTLGGYAGSGKTSVIKYLSKFLPKFAVCAFTGKATMVLRSKGLHADTIHSLIYTPEKQDDGTVEFVLKPFIDYEGFIIDESSMISEEIYVDMISFGIPIIWVGDHGQLEPVGTDFNLMKDPMYKLEKIHRNSGEIAKFAQWLREGRNSIAFEGDGSQVEFTSFQDITPEQYLNADQIICAYNKTRVKVNETVRKYLGYKDIVEIGEKIICLQNNKEIGLYNGLQGYVKELYYNEDGRHYLDLDTETENIFDIHYDRFQFGQEKSTFEWYEGMPNPFDYAYCITAHKAQGSEANKVIVIEQRCKNWEHSRWAYTAASRAKEKLLWAL